MENNKHKIFVRVPLLKKSQPQLNIFSGHLIFFLLNVRITHHIRILIFDQLKDS